MSLLKVAGTTAASGTLYVDDVFSTYLYTGDGSTSRAINNGIDLAGKGGLVWTKSRIAVYHNLEDTVRGVGNTLWSNATSPNYYYSDAITSFGSTAYTLGADLSGGQVNQSPLNYVSWTFRKAAKFFDVVAFTANSSGGGTISHSLGVVPGMVITKSTSGTGDWLVYHRSTGTSKYLELNSGLGERTGTDWISVSSTSVTFSNGYLGADNSRIAYLFAHDTASDGIIQCGSYTGNGSATGSTISLGWEPQYLMVKNASGTGNWQILDSMRGMPVGSADATLQANLSNAESSVEYLSPTATGFQITSTSTEVNTSGSTYIYMAIRRPNKPPTSGTQVFGLNARTGTGANATVTGGQVDDAVLIKNRGAAVADLFSSRLTGTGYLVTSSTATEVAAGTTILQANPWDVMDGVKVGTTSTITNASANTFINYFFKRAPGFFDEVCFTASGSNFTVTHNLKAVPDLVITKCRSDANTDWNTYASPIGNTKNLVLNATSPAYTLNVWQNTTPTATSLFLTGGGDYFSMGSTYVAYLFATLAGISKVGSYTGNGTGQAIACGFSAGARFVLIKRTDAVGDWYTFDSARGLTSGSSPYLLLDSTAAETTGNNGVYASTGGFTLGSTASTTTNINGASYIYLSVA